jgi:Amt family ammonium transporter
MDDFFWLLSSALLVFVMQAGFLCLETGRIRSKNSINVAAKNVADFILAVAVFWLFGFALMFGDSIYGLVGSSGFLFDGTKIEGANASWDVSFFLFQMMFCGTATTIMSGAVAERMSFNGYLWSALVLCAIVYPISGHWAWAGILNPNNQGWLEALGFIDFAGSLVVHGVGGCVSLAAVLIIGSRLGRFDPDKHIPQGSNLPFASLGVLLLWFGWFGFNGGSTLLFNGQVPVIILNTCIAAAWGGITCSLIHYYLYRFADVTLILNGVIGGLVGITASCFAVDSLDAMVIGVVSGVLVFYGEHWLLKKKIDDALGVIPAHLFCGIWGVLSVGVFADLDTLATGLTRFEQIGIQLLGIIVICLWAIVVSYLLLNLINRFVPLRVSAEAEFIGMNVSEHNSATELLDLLNSMKQQQSQGDFSTPVPEEPFTEVGVVAHQYNQVIERVRTEILARDQAINDFRDSEKRKSAILDSSMDCIVTINHKGQILEFNPAAERTFDCTRRLVTGQNFISLFVLEEQKLTVNANLQHGFSTHDGLLINRRNNLTLQRKSGSKFPAEISITVSTVYSQSDREFILNIRDVTRQRKLQQKLKQLAYSDPLTGLYNRTYLVENLKAAINHVQQHEEESLVLYFLDLDKFKRINDTLGHKAGDGLLCEVANRLSRVTRDSDVISRWGGDEFIIMMHGRLTCEFARQKAEDILAVMREPVEIEGYLLNIPTSIGIAYAASSEPFLDADKLIQNADIAMYQAKLKGRDNYQFFDQNMASESSEHFQLERELKTDLASERFYVVYQPKVNNDNKIIGLEALSRWNHREKGSVSPIEFIAVAEESNLIFELGECVIDHCLHQLLQWRSQRRCLVPIAVNISGRHLISPNFLPFLKRRLNEMNIEGHLLEIEITEGVLVSDIDRCIAVMNELKALGVSIAIDDFGTGYSSLNYLKRLPLDVIKIDKSFIDECAMVDEDSKICSTIINLAKNLGLKTVAEGVENIEQQGFLAAEGCDYFQGYMFYKPLDAHIVTEILPLRPLPRVVS